MARSVQRSRSWLLRSERVNISPANLRKEVLRKTHFLRALALGYEHFWRPVDRRQSPLGQRWAKLVDFPFPTSLASTVARYDSTVLSSAGMPCARNAALWWHVPSSTIRSKVRFRA